MYNDLEKKLSLLQEPTAFKIKSFDELLHENIELAKEILGSEWLPLESDSYMKKLRVLTLRQIHNQADKKETVKQFLVTTATGVDLDHLGSSVGIFRDKGEYPYTNFEFKLLAPSHEDLTIPAGLILNSKDDGYKAHTVNSILIKAGSLSVIVRAELEEYVTQSDIKTEHLVTELTFAVDIKQLDIFKNGADAESDDRYRLRIIASNDKHSTAGSVEAYKYFAYSADSRISDISIPDDNEPLDVNIYLASFDIVDDVMIDKVYQACNEKYTRPLGDNLTVAPAEIVYVDLSATIELFDLLKQVEIDSKIKANFKDSFFIGQNFVKSDFIRKCHIDGVYKVDSEFEDIKVSNKQVIKIASFDFTYKQAAL
jgi:phage-related baseplate assembly protein